MTRLTNPVLDNSLFVLATTVVFGERMLFPIFQIVVSMLESSMVSIEVSQEPLLQLEFLLKQYDLIETVQSDEAHGAMILPEIEAG